MPNTDIIPFAFEGVELRALTIDNEPWFVTADVLSILRLDRTANRRLDDDEMGVAPIHTLGGVQNLSIVSEAGLYSLILGSRKTEARTFKRWVTHEVLPQIRRTGTYGNPADDLALPATYLEALEALVARERANQQLAVENAHLAPRADAWDAIASAEGDFSVGQAANMLGRAGVQNLGPQRLFRKLEELGWIYRGEDHSWRPFAHRVDKGYLGVKPQFHYHPGTGEKVVDAPQLRVTLKGIEQLRQRLGGSQPILRAVSA